MVLVSTSGNQRYVFASNKLREAVGASHLVAMSTTEWVHDALPRDASVLQESSGTTLVQVADEAQAHALARNLTRKAQDKAPGLDLSVVSVPVAGEQVTRHDVDRVFREDHRHRARHPSALVRFPRLPVVASCASTDLPAMGWHSDSGPGKDGSYRDGETPQALSAEVIAKRRARPDAVKSVEQMLARNGATQGMGLIKLDDFFDKVEWSAVVHADGNRLGALFQTAIEHLAPAELSQLSTDVATVAERAFCDAVAALSTLVGKDHESLPVVPLVIGGDDLTMLVEGSYALGVVDAYLQGFSRHAAESELIGRASKLAGRAALTVSAGVAIVKPHFPFSVAYRLSEDLCQSAKRLVDKHPGCHGLDAHVLLDSVITSLDAIRDGYRVERDEPIELTQRPYLLPVVDDAVPPAHDWTNVLESLRTVQRVRGGEELVMTRTQLHALREELRVDPEKAQRRLADLHARATEKADRDVLRAIAGDPPLAVKDGSSPLLDLLELSPFAGPGATR